MKLWHIYQTKNTRYDAYTSAVVAAETEEAAKNMHPFEGELQSDSVYDWVISADDVICEYLGTATGAIKRGVICRN